MSFRVQMDLLPPRVSEFLNYLAAVKNRSMNTLQWYATDLRLFFLYMESVRKNLDFKSLDHAYDLSGIDDAYIGSVTIADIYNFFSFTGLQLKNSVTTRNRRASSIRGFFHYVSDNMGYISKNPASQLSIASEKKKLPRYLTLEQSRDLLAAVDGKFKERDYCILTLFLNCGLRLAELCALNLSDIDFTERTLLVTGKGNKQRMLYLNDACLQSILSYLRVRPVDGLKGSDRDALFINLRNKRFERQGVQLMVYKYLDKIGLHGQHYSVHKLRHTAATLMYQHGNIDVLVIKDVLGHENLATTEIYTHVANKQIQEAIEKNPLNVPADKKPEEDPA